MNPADLMKIMGIKNTIEKNHPKLFPFLNALRQKGLQEGAVIEMSVTTPDGEKIMSNIKVQQSDIDAIMQLSSFAPKN